MNRVLKAIAILIWGDRPSLPKPKPKWIPKVGEVVFIKDWDEMVSQYGYKEKAEYIRASGMVFFKENQDLCGTRHIILEIEKPDATDNYWKITLDIEDHIYGQPRFCKSVLVPARFSKMVMKWVRDIKKKNGGTC